jgi:hypothetical protein
MAKRLPAVKEKTDKTSKSARPRIVSTLISFNYLPETYLSVKMTPDQESAWEDRFRPKIKVGTLDGTFRLSRQAYWEEQRRSRQPAKLRSTILEAEQQVYAVSSVPQDRGGNVLRLEVASCRAMI